MYLGAIAIVAMLWLYLRGSRNEWGLATAMIACGVLFTVNPGRLVEAVTEKLAAGEQTVLLMNRRGFSSSVACRSCGERIDRLRVSRLEVRQGRDV